MRDPRFERDFIDQAARQARLASTGFQELVHDRLALGSRLYEDAALSVTLVELAREIAEEGADLATWSALAAQSDDFNARDPAEREEIMRWLLYLASLGARVEYSVQQLRQILD